jgi:zinc transport system substrate-binding protein
MAEIATALGAELGKIHPQKEKIYKKNAQALKEKLLQQHQQYKTTLASCKRTGFIVTHDFLGYLARRYDFQTHPIKGLSTLDEPSAKGILELKKLSKKNISFLLAEDNFPSGLADILIKETNLTLLPIDNLTIAKENLDYFLRMKNNFQSIQKALGC